MANRYWVGGSGKWDGFDTTHWSDTSGGAGGASIPTPSDDVFFDSASGGGIVTLGSLYRFAKNLTIEAPSAGTLTFLVDLLTVIRIYGSLTMATTNVIIEEQAAPWLLGFEFWAASGSHTIDVGNRVFTKSYISIGLAVSTATWTVQSDLVVNFSDSDSYSIGLGNGTINMGSHNITAYKVSASGGPHVGSGTVTCRTFTSTTGGSYELTGDIHIYERLSDAGVIKNANNVFFYDTYNTALSTNGYFSLGTVTLVFSNPGSSLSFNYTTNTRAVAKLSSGTSPAPAVQIVAGGSLTVGTWDVKGSATAPATLTSTASATLTKSTAGPAVLQYVNFQNIVANPANTWFYVGGTDLGGNTGIRRLGSGLFFGSNF